MTSHAKLPTGLRAKSQIGHRSTAMRFLRCCRGAAAVEAAFVLPVFFAGLFIVVEFGRVFYSKVEFEYAFSSAIRTGMVQKVATKATMTKALGDSMITLDPLQVLDVGFSETNNADNTRTAAWSAAYRIDLLAPITSQKSIKVSK